MHKDKGRLMCKKSVDRRQTWVSGNYVLIFHISISCGFSYDVTQVVLDRMTAALFSLFSHTKKSLK